MISSMTGYGSSSIEYKDLSLKVSIKSLNSRYFSLDMKLPNIFYPLEQKIRDLVSRRCKRGKVDVRIKYSLKNNNMLDLSMDKINSYQKNFEDIANTLDIKGQSIDINS